MSDDAFFIGTSLRPRPRFRFSNINKLYWPWPRLQVWIFFVDICFADSIIINSIICITLHFRYFKASLPLSCFGRVQLSFKVYEGQLKVPKRLQLFSFEGVRLCARYVRGRCAFIAATQRSLGGKYSILRHVKSSVFPERVLTGHQLPTCVEERRHVNELKCQK